MYNIKAFEEILDYFKEDISFLNLRLKSLLHSENFPKESGFLDEIEGFLFAKAKRLRPLVIFLIADMFKNTSPLCNNFNEAEFREDILNLALSVEILHSATLIHDDIVDDGKLRRGREAFYLKFGPKIAVLAGDFLLSLAIKVLSKIKSEKSVKYFAEGTLKISSGEIRQFLNRGKIVTIEDYLEKSKDKTGALFNIGAKCALDIVSKNKNISHDTVERVLGAVEKFSLGFQIYDDIENFIENTKECETVENKQDSDGQKISSDIENGVYTLPYLYLSHKNFFYDNITKEARNQAIDFSNRYLNKTLDEGISLLLSVKDSKCDLMMKLIETFKN